MARLLYTLAVGAVGAALVAVAILLLLPGFVADQQWQTLAAVLPPERPTRLSSQGAGNAPGAPFFLTALCRFDLRQGPLHVSARGRAPFWSGAVYTPDGQVVASLNSGMIGDAAPDFRVLTPGQMPRFPGPGPFPLEAEAGDALLALRVFVPDDTWKLLGEALLSNLSCRTER